MLKSSIRRLKQQFGSPIIKTPHLRSIKKFKKTSDDTRFDYYKTPNGKYYLPKSFGSDSVANAIRCGKLFDAEILGIAKSYIKPNSTILDIGANYGQTAIEFSKIAAGTTVFAFEAQQMIYDSLEKNISANLSNNVMCFHNTVYDTNNLELTYPEADLVKFSSPGSYGLDLEAKTGKLAKSITIDRLQFFSPVSFMKINGQETGLAAMKGAVNTISKHRMPIIFKYEKQLQTDFNTSFQYYVDFVESIHYKFLKTVDATNYLIVPK